MGGGPASRAPSIVDRSCCGQRHGVRLAARPYALSVIVVFRTGSVLHHLPELTAVLLAENLRAYPFAEGSKAVADKIELYLVGESTEPIELDDISERLAVREMLDRLFAVPAHADDPVLREFFDCLRIEPLRR